MQVTKKLPTAAVHTGVNSPVMIYLLFIITGCNKFVGTFLATLSVTVPCKQLRPTAARVFSCSFLIVLMPCIVMVIKSFVTTTADIVRFRQLHSLQFTILIFSFLSLLTIAPISEHLQLKYHSRFWHEILVSLWL